MTTAKIDFPDLFDSTVDDKFLDQYFIDIETVTDIIEISIKNHPEQYAQQQKLNLHHVQQWLKSHEIRGVQIRYLYQEQEWIDTIFVQQGWFRIIRMAQKNFGEMEIV